MRVEVFNWLRCVTAFGEIGFVIQISQICHDTPIVTQIFSVSKFLGAGEGFIQFFAVAPTDYLNRMVRNT